MHSAGLYIHLPFCASSCSYCSFVTTTNQDLLPRYMQALQKELAFLGQRAGRPLTTLYLGGGTPSLVPAEELTKLFAVLDVFFPRSPGAEVTLEANPDDVNLAKIALWRKLGINRISLGVQSLADDVLRLLARRHNSVQAQRALALLMKAGFVVSCDLMLGLPGLSLGKLRDTLDHLMSFRPHHISLYLLELDKPHRLAELAKRHPEFFPSDEAAAEQYLAARAFLRQSGYRHYEISNFALPGRFARHNLRYWRGGVVLAAGVAAAGQGHQSRWGNTDDLQEYLKKLAHGQIPRAWHRSLPTEEAKAEKLMLRLRLAEGAPVAWVQEVARWRPAFAGKVGDFLAAGLARICGKKLRLLPKGWLLSNELFATLV